MPTLSGLWGMMSPQVICCAVEPNPVQRVPTLSALWGMRSPQVICCPVEPSPVQRVPTLLALWSMRSPQVICCPVEPSTESADTVGTLENEVSTGHMLPSTNQFRECQHRQHIDV